MKNKNIFKFIFLLTAVCAVFLPAQDKNTIIKDEKKGEPMAIGFSTREVFSDTSFSGWFDSEYESYVIDTATLDEIGEIPDEIKITIVMGTWCSDSHMQVPRLYKILDYLQYPSEEVTLIAVDREKKGLEGEVTDLNIEFVPTIIFYDNEEEIGRIIEAPEETLEKDILSIMEE